jgi:hypothetical protein
MKGMNGFSNRLVTTAQLLRDVANFQTVIGTFQNHLGPAHGEAPVGFQSLAQLATFFFCQWTCIFWFHPSI